MSPYQQQNPQFQQQQFQPQGQPNVIDHLLGEILRAIVHIVAKDMHSDFLDQVAKFDDPHALLQVLTQYNNANEAKIQRREHLQKAPAAPAAGTPRRRGDGSLDVFNQRDATARTRAIFQQAGTRGK